MRSKMKNVAVYCRVSTDHDDQKNSIENQKLYFEDYVKQHKDWKLVDIYADEGISGTSLKKRNQFNLMYKEALKNKYDIILTKEVCRFARNTVDTLEKTRELKRKGVEVRFLIDNISTFDTDGEFRLTLMAGIAQDESRRISERVQFGVIQNMKKGVAFGNIVYGYDFVRDEITGKKTKLVVNQEEAKIVKYIFNAYLNEGKGAYTIAQELKSMGVLVKRPRNKEKSTDWRTGTILDMLRNVKYIGDLKQRITYTVDFLEHIKKENKGEVDFIEVKNHHEPIIDRETFEKTQIELSRRSNICGMEKSKYSNRHTFSGKLICAECGGHYVGGVSKLRKDGTRKRSWRCSTAVNYGKKHLNGDEEVGCDNVRVDDKLLKDSFSLIMKEVVKDKKKLKKDISKSLADIIIKSRAELIDVESVIVKKDKIEREKSRLLDLCLKEIVTENDFKIKNEELNDKLNKIELEMLELQDKKRRKDNINEIIEKIEQKIDSILSTKTFSSNVCKELIDKVIVHSKSKFDFYLKGYNDPFDISKKGDILYSQH